MNSIERRVLAYLDQRGGSANREAVVCDLANPDSNLGRGYVNGSNGGVPRIMGAWCHRLIKRGYVREVRDDAGSYRHHRITDSGRKALRECADAQDKEKQPTE